MRGLRIPDGLWRKHLRFAALASAIVFVLTGTSCDDVNPLSSGPTATPTRRALVIPTRTPTPTPRPLPTATPRPDFSAVPQLQGLDSPGPDRTPDLVVAAELPPQRFPVFTGRNTVIYDTINMTAVDLGPGTIGAFSPDSRHMTWAASWDTGAEAWVIDLYTGERWSLGRGHGNFVDDRTVERTSSDPAAPASTRELVDIYTLETRPVTPRPASSDPAVRQMTLPAGRTARFYCSNRAPYVCTYALYAADGTPLFQFNALTFEPAGDTHLAVIAAPIADPRGERHPSGLYLVEIETQAVEFIAQVLLDSNQPLVATEEYVAWTDRRCSQPRGFVRVFDRRSGQLTEVLVNGYISAARPGVLGFGDFGAKALYDVAANRLIFATTPDTNGRPLQIGQGTHWGGGDSHWSPDWRFMTQGLALGHGGACG